MLQDDFLNSEPFDQRDANPLLVGLNKAQREAVTHKDGPLLVLAGPGSGKTRVVTHRVAWLLQNGVRDYQIAALTFTNKAADEMKTRLQNLAPGARVWVGTFHRFCAYLLRYYARFVQLEGNFAIYDADESQKLLKGIVPNKSLPPGIDVSKVASAISWAKNSLVSADEYCARAGSLLGKVVEEAYPAYQAALKKANAVDFDDLLFHVAVLLKENPEIRARLDSRFRYILVDEYQDTNFVQYAIARALSVDYPNLAATGDPDQSIYGWRGAQLDNILNFERDFPDAKVVRLEQNYRSVKSVLRVADSLIKHNVYRKDKELYTDNPEGVSPRIIVNADQNEEAETIAAEIAAELLSGKRNARDYAIFYRMNALSRNLEYALRRYGVPYQLVRGLEFFNRKEVKDVCSYLQLVYNPSDVVSFKRVVNLPTRGIGNVTLTRLEKFAEENNITLFEAARAATRIDSLSTRAQKSLKKFVSLIDRVRKTVDDGSDLEVVLGMILTESKYLEFLRNSIKTDADEQRLANIQELLSEVREFDADFVQIEEERRADQLFPQAGQTCDRLGTFLEQIALISDVDSWSANEDRVSLMTLHAAKGLEFPVVYIVAIEDGVLPHQRSSDEERQLEEERRLLFVGLTRAMEELRLSYTHMREFRGSQSFTIPSRFLYEFPKGGIDKFSSQEAWLRALKAEAAADPHAKIVIPNFFDRIKGTSQRRAFWKEAPRNFLQADEDQLVSKKERDDSVDSDLTFEADPESIQDFYDADVPEIDVNDESGARSRKNDASDKNLSAAKWQGIKPNALSAASKLDGWRDPKERESIGLPPRKIVVNSFVQHKKYGTGVVKKIHGPSFDQIASISFLSEVGMLDLPLSDPDLTLVAIGRGRNPS
ncbi:MAG: ATP-dependent helicase [Thermoguttaceae bacterium]|jgi:DNA helicase-2/ATP-dependent DNA helicase PcrA